MPERAYADIMGNFRRGMGRQRSGAGDYEGAMRADPDNAESYAALADRQRENQQREMMQGAQRSYAQSLAGGDYEAAQTIAGKVGDVEGVTGARAAQQEVTEQQRIEAWRVLRDYRNRIGEIAQSPDPQSGYSALITEAREQSTSPDMAAFLDRLPQQWDPNVQRMLDGTLRTWMERLLTPQQLADLELQRENQDRQRRRPATSEEIAAAGLRPGTATQMDGDGQIYVLQSPSERGADGGDVFDILTPDEVRANNLREGATYQINRRTRQITTVGSGVPSQFNEGAANAAQFADRMQGSERNIAALGPNIDWGAVWAAEWLPADDRTRQARQAVRSFINAVMRRESGAAISAEEWASARQLYYPVPGDGPEVIAQKAAERQRVLIGMINASQGAYQAFYGDDGDRERPSSPAPAAPRAAATPARPPRVPPDYVWNPEEQTWDPPN